MMIIEKAKRLQNVTEYYFSTKLAEVASLIEQGKPIINLGIGSPDLAPSKKVIKSIKRAINKKDKHSYQSYRGIDELRTEVANFYKEKFKVSLNAKNEILPLMGSKEGIVLISMAFLNKGDAVLLPNPGYATYTSATNLMEAKTIYYDLTKASNWLPDIKRLEKEDLSKVKIMWLNYPHMPTGANATLADFKTLIQFAKKHNILLVNDNPYSFILNKKPLSILAVEGAKEVALELNSLSKTFNIAGWRVGTLLGDAKYINTVLKVKSNMDSGMFYGIQKGAIAALRLSDKWYDSLNEKYEERREIVYKILDKLNCVYDRENSGLFVWAKVPKGSTAEVLCDELLHQKSIFIVPGKVFGSNGKDYIRISLCATKKKLKEALLRL